MGLGDTVYDLQRDNDQKPEDREAYQDPFPCEQWTVSSIDLSCADGRPKSVFRQFGGRHNGIFLGRSLTVKFGTWGPHGSAAILKLVFGALSVRILTC